MNSSTKTRIKFYAHLIFPETKDIGEMFKSINITCNAVKTVAGAFDGKSIYTGDGSEVVQYDSVVEFESLSEADEKSILNVYPFARKITF